MGEKSDRIGQNKYSFFVEINISALKKINIVKELAIQIPFIIVYWLILQFHL